MQSKFPPIYWLSHRNPIQPYSLCKRKAPFKNALFRRPLSQPTYIHSILLYAVPSFSRRGCCCKQSASTVFLLRLLQILQHSYCTLRYSIVVDSCSFKRSMSICHFDSSFPTQSTLWPQTEVSVEQVHSVAVSECLTTWIAPASAYARVLHSSTTVYAAKVHIPQSKRRPHVSQWYGLTLTIRQWILWAYRIKCKRRKAFGSTLSYLGQVRYNEHYRFPRLICGWSQLIE